MRKLKLTIIAIAIVGSVGGAFASKKRCALCEAYTQYHKVNGGYEEAGDFGYDYGCWQLSGNTCTWYKPDPVNQPDYYAPCRSGVYDN
jgi:hypothetical protein